MPTSFDYWTVPVYTGRDEIPSEGDSSGGDKDKLYGPRSAQKSIYSKDKCHSWYEASGYFKIDLKKMWTYPLKFNLLITFQINRSIVQSVKIVTNAHHSFPEPEVVS